MEADNEKRPKLEPATLTRTLPVTGAFITPECPNPDMLMASYVHAREKYVALDSDPPETIKLLDCDAGSAPGPILHLTEEKDIQVVSEQAVCTT